MGFGVWGLGQRVNQELKTLEREGVIRVESTGLVVCEREALLRIGEGEP